MSTFYGPHPGQPLHDVRCCYQDHRHHHVQLAEPRRALIVDEKPHVKSWDEPQYSIQNLGIEESYGFGVLNEGQAIAVAKNVKVRQNEMSTPGALILSSQSGDAVFQLPSGLVG